MFEILQEAGGDPGSRTLWARSLGGLGPGPPELGARPTRGLGPSPPPSQKPPKPLNYDFSQISWSETAASEVGTWRETKPPPLPPPPSPPSATIQHAPRRITPTPEFEFSCCCSVLDAGLSSLTVREVRNLGLEIF